MSNGTLGGKFSRLGDKQRQGDDAARAIVDNAQDKINKNCKELIFPCHKPDLLSLLLVLTRPGTLALHE